MGTAEKCFTWEGSSFTFKDYTRLEIPAKDKHSSLLGTLVNYDEKKFYNIGPRTAEREIAVI